MNSTKSRSSSSTKLSSSTTTSLMSNVDTDVGQRLYRKCFYARISKQSQKPQSKSLLHSHHSRRQTSPPKGTVASASAWRSSHRNRRDSCDSHENVSDSDNVSVDKSITPPPAEVASLGIECLVGAKKSNA